jgi:rare lipoprotein A (peptidoglycan hydrolase)
VAAQMLAYEQGRISFYAQHFAGRATASGELFDGGHDHGARTCLSGRWCE